jgi:hypothetical protein
VPEGAVEFDGPDWNGPNDKRRRTVDEELVLAGETARLYGTKATSNDSFMDVEEDLATSLAEEKAQAQPQQKPDVQERINPFSSIPFFPTSSEGSPKLALNSLYGKEFGGAQVTNSAFFFWDDNGPPHMRKHTCVFVCPVTYERFPAGRQGNSEKFTFDETSGIVWYNQKKQAEHGAAARRSDCYYYRKCYELNPEAEPVRHWGLDISYNEGRGPPVLLPAAIEEAIVVQVQLWREEVAIRAEQEGARQLELEQAALEEEEARLDVQTYREQRMMATAM